MFVIDARSPCACCARRCRGALRAHARKSCVLAPLVAMGRSRDVRGRLAIVSRDRYGTTRRGRSPTFGILRRHAGGRRRLLAGRPSQPYRRDRLLARASVAGPRRDDAMLPLRRALWFPDARPESHPDRCRHGESRSRAIPERLGFKFEESCVPARTSTATSSTTRCTRCCAATSTGRGVRPRRACRPIAGLPSSPLCHRPRLPRPRAGGALIGVAVVIAVVAGGVAAWAQLGANRAPALAGFKSLRRIRTIPRRSRRGSRSRPGSSTRGRANMARRRCGASISRAAGPEATRARAALLRRGIAILGGLLYQLTWQNGVVVVYDLETFEVERTLQYDGEGWGLTRRPAAHHERRLGHDPSAIRRRSRSRARSRCVTTACRS